MSNNTIDNNLLIVLNRTLNRSRARGLVASSLWAAELLYELDNGGDFNYKKGDFIYAIPFSRP